MGPPPCSASPRQGQPYPRAHGARGQLKGSSEMMLSSPGVPPPHPPATAIPLLPRVELGFASLPTHLCR